MENKKQPNETVALKSERVSSIMRMFPSLRCYISAVD